MHATLLLLAVLGCAPKRPASPGTPSPPFTAEQIRAGMPTGLVLRFVLSTPGEPPRKTSWHVEQQTETTVTVRYEEPRAGQSQSETRQHTWDELESHAHFPVLATTWQDGPLTLAGTTYPHARTYVVHRVEEGHPIEEHFGFSLDHPGPPVLTRTVRHGEEQVRVVLVERLLPATH